MKATPKGTVSAEERERWREFLTTEEVAEKIRKPVGTLRQWRHRGYGPRGFKVGNTVLYRSSVVDAWIAEQEAAELAGAA